MRAKKADDEVKKALELAKQGKLSPEEREKILKIYREMQK